MSAETELARQWLAKGQNDLPNADNNPLVWLEYL